MRVKLGMAVLALIGAATVSGCSGAGSPSAPAAASVPPSTPSTPSPPRSLPTVSVRPVPPSPTATSRLEAAQVALSSDLGVLGAAVKTAEHSTGGTTAVGGVRHALGDLRNAVKARDCALASSRLAAVLSAAHTELANVARSTGYLPLLTDRLASDITAIRAAAGSTGTAAVNAAEASYRTAQAQAAQAQQTVLASAASTTGTVNGLIATANQVVAGRGC